MAKKKKAAIPAPQNREELERLVGDYAIQEIAIAQLTAELDERLLAVRAEYEQRLGARAEQRDALGEAIGAWGEMNKAAFGEKRSLELMHGTIGWRLGKPTVKLRPRVRAEDAVSLCKSTENSDLIRIKAELDKEQILNRYAGNKITDEQLEAIGVKIEQTERFFVDVKTEAQS